MPQQNRTSRRVTLERVQKDEFPTAAESLNRPGRDLCASNAGESRRAMPQTLCRRQLPAKSPSPPEAVHQTPEAPPIELVQGDCHPRGIAIASSALVVASAVVAVPVEVVIVVVFFPLRSKKKTGIAGDDTNVSA